MRLQRGEGASIRIPNTERKLRIEGKDKFKSANVCKYVHVFECAQEGCKFYQPAFQKVVVNL